jgi:hypothetical protein
MGEQAVYPTESKLTSSEDILQILTSNPPSTQFNKVKLLIRELKFAKSELTLINSDFQWLLQWIWAIKLEKISDRGYRQVLSPDYSPKGM